MVNFGEKAKIKKAGNLNSGRSYVITTVLTEISIKVLLDESVYIGAFYMWLFLQELFYWYWNNQCL